MTASQYQRKRKQLYHISRIPSPLRHLAVNCINPLRTAYIRQSRPLRWITFFITSRCNARCEHCFFWNELEGEKSEMSLDKLESVFGSLRTRLRTLRLSGGEPFLYKELEAFDEFIDSRRIANKLQIPTNGMLDIVPLVERMLNRSRFTHLNVRISLDGLEERHNAIRKVHNGFQKAVDNLQKLIATQRENGSHFSVSVGITLTRTTCLPKNDGPSEVEKLITYLCDEVGIPKSGIAFDHVRSVETDSYHLSPALWSTFSLPPKEEGEKSSSHKRKEELHLSPDEIEEVNHRLFRLLGTESDPLHIERLERQLRTKREKKRVIGCVAGDVSGVIYPDGGVSACEFTNTFANLKDYNYNLHELWRSSAALKRRELIRKCACTHPCHMSDSLAYDTDFLKKYTDALSNRC